MIVKALGWVRLAAAGCVCCLAAAFAPAQTTPIAITGDTVPGGNGKFLALGTPAINSNGLTAFSATLTNTSGGSSDNMGIFTSSSQIVRKGQAAPDLDGAYAVFMDSPALNDNGQVAFWAELSGANNIGIFRGSGGIVTQVARKGQAAPDADGTLSTIGFWTALNNSGQVAFDARLTGTANNEGIFRGSGGSLTQIARKGQAVPDGDGSFSDFNGLALNRNGEVAFQSLTTSSSNFWGVFRGSGGSVIQIARTGKDMPPHTGGGKLDVLGDPVLNDSGQALFWATITGTANDHAIIRGSLDSNFVDLVREGRTAPDGDGTFSTFGYPALNDSGQIAFWTTLTGTANYQGIFRMSGFDNPIQIARMGQAAPDGDGTFSSFGQPDLNGGGQVAFMGYLGDTANDRGLFLSDGQETLQVVRKGEFLAGSTVSDIAFRGGPNRGGQRALNDFGQVAYQATMVNGTNAVFVFTPELHYRSALSGAWDTKANWTLSLQPGTPHNVSIDPSAGLTVTGPVSAVTVKTVTVNSTGPNAATLSLQNSGKITVNEGFTLGPRGKLTGSGQIAGDFTAQAGSVIEPTGDMALGATSFFYMPSSIAGTLNVGNHTVTLASPYGFSLSGTTTLGGGRLVSLAGINNSGILRGDGEVAAGLENAIAGQVRVATGERLAFTGSFNVNNGLISAIGGELEFSGGLINSAVTGSITARNGILRFTGGLNNSGSMGFSFGTSDVFGDINNLGGGKIIVSGSSQLTLYDDIVNNAGGEIRVSAGSTAVYFGAVSGGGSWTGTGINQFEGDLRPGASPAEVSFGGNVELGLFANLDMELGGTTAGSQYDKLDVAGSLTLDGTLNVTLINGFTPGAGNWFDLFDSSSLNGTFDTINLPSLSSGLAWDTTQLYVSGQLSVVPEPSSVALIIAGASVLFALRRKAKR